MNLLSLRWTKNRRVILENELYWEQILTRNWRSNFTIWLVSVDGGQGIFYENFTVVYKRKLLSSCYAFLYINSFYTFLRILWLLYTLGYLSLSRLLWYRVLLFLCIPYKSPQGPFEVQVLVISVSHCHRSRSNKEIFS